MVVAPLRQGRQGSEHRFDAASALQAVAGAPVDGQVEFGVASAPQQLPVPLAGAVGQGAALLQDRRIGRHEGLAYAAGESQAGLEAALRPIVEEQPADAARLVAMAQMEILIASPLHPRIVPSSRLLGGLMPSHAVLGEPIARRQVETAAEVPCRRRSIH